MNRNASLSSPVLDRIVSAARDEVIRLRPDAAALRAAAEARPPAPGLEASLRSGRGVRVIAEVKRRSPSAGGIREDIIPADQAALYEGGGAAAISVLTERVHFGGSIADLEAVTGVVSVPVLRKDFTLDEVQVYEGRAAGASAVLLIVRILDDARLADLATLVQELGMDALVEVHDEAEAERALGAGARIIGVNNRDLDRFTTDLAVTERLAPLLPSEVVLVAESGIASVADVERLAAAGADAVLVGEALMRAADPSSQVSAFSAIPRAGR